MLTGSKLSISLYDDSGSEVVEHKGLVCLCDAKLPRQTGMFNTGPATCSGTAIVTGDGDVLGLRLDIICFVLIITISVFLN